MELNKVVCMDNLEFMRTLTSESIDLIYSDILYGTGRKFKDYQDLKPNKEVIYEFYKPRIKEMHRLLKPTGSIYLQMDWRIVHWIRCILDDVFGSEMCRSEIIWGYGLGNANCKDNYLQKHDNILYYTKNNDFTYNMQRGEITKSMASKYCHEDENGKYMISYGKKYYLKGGKPLENVWMDIPNLSATSKERIGYDTQKPLELMERIIKASSNEGDTVADFFMGSGSFLVKANELNRKYIGCDTNTRAVEITVNRINGYIHIE